MKTILYKIFNTFIVFLRPISDQNIGNLTIVFVILKLLHVLNWNYVWIISPLWTNAIFLIIAAWIQRTLRN
jgi:hypothetical protein